MLKPDRSNMCRILVVVALALVAASCGGSDDTAAAPDLSSSASDTTAGAQDAAPSNDVLDLAAKPLVDADLLGSVDELVITDVIEGDGEEAVAGLFISMQYVGVLLADGTEFDSSWDRGGVPFDFTLGVGEVIPGWDQGIVGMRVGGRRILQIPSALAYGSQARGDVIGADADLLFIVDLVAVQPPPTPPPPAEPSPPIPEDALGAFDELGIIDLVEGTGEAVAIGDIVEVQYVGVSADDGTEFDSSWSRGGIPFRLSAGKSEVIEGWKQGLMGMKVGGERILQIPSAMAYGEGDLVFRVHLELLIDAPYAYTLTFEGPPPTEVEVTTVVEGSGPGAEVGDAVDGNVTVLYYNDSRVIQSTWEDGSTTSLFLQPEALLPGLNDALVGVKVGETRQIVLPSNLAFPNGFPPDSGLGPNDAVVFIVEPLAIESLGGE